MHEKEHLWYLICEAIHMYIVSVFWWVYIYFICSYNMYLLKLCYVHMHRQCNVKVWGNVWTKIHRLIVEIVNKLTFRIILFSHIVNLNRAYNSLQSQSYRIATGKMSRWSVVAVVEKKKRNNNAKIHISKWNNTKNGCETLSECNYTIRSQLTSKCISIILIWVDVVECWNSEMGRIRRNVVPTECIRLHNQTPTRYLVLFEIWDLQFFGCHCVLPGYVPCQQIVCTHFTCVKCPLTYNIHILFWWCFCVEKPNLICFNSVLILKFTWYRITHGLQLSTPSIRLHETPKQFKKLKWRRKGEQKRSENIWMHLSNLKRKYNINAPQTPFNLYIPWNGEKEPLKFISYSVLNIFHSGLGWKYE